MCRFLRSVPCYLFLAVVVACAIVNAQEQRHALYDTQQLAKSVSISATIARNLLDNKDPRDRLLVPMLTQNATRLCEFTQRSVVRGKMLEDSPVDIFVFSPDKDLKKKYHDNCNVTAAFYFLDVREHWVTPPEAGNKSGWGVPDWFDEDYRRMGHWRLIFPFHFARELGYPYVFTLDDDSYLDEPLKFDLVAEMRTRKLDLAAHNVLKDIPEVMVGLPELARYFLVTEGLQPVGSIFEHVDPPTLEGLFSEGTVNTTARGWDRKYLYGNFVLISVDFWFQDMVQRFLQLCMRTGGHFRFRWNEQGVMAMVWQLFVPKDRFWKMADSMPNYKHKEHFG